jgi:hypothetical protein
MKKLKKKQIILKQIMKNNPDWKWNSLNGRGFYELMQLYRFTYVEDQKIVSEYFEIIKDYIRWYKNITK